MYDIIDINYAVADWALWAALGSVVTNVVSGIASFFSNKKTNSTNREINQENNEFNSEQAQVARNWQEQMYQNYESPTAQVQQRLQAGLNPFDGITSQAVGSASTASASSASPQIPFDFTSAFGDIGDKSLLYGQLKSQKLQNTYQENLNEQQATDLEIKKEQLNSSRYDNALKAVELGYKEQALEADIASAKAQAESNNWSAKKLQAEIDRIKLDYKMAEEAYNLGANPYTDAHETANQNIAESQARINDMVATLPYRLEDIMSQVDLRDANISQLEASAELLRAEQTKLGIESDYLKLQYDNLALTTNASVWYGFDVTRLPPTLYRFCVAIYRDVMNGHISPQEGKTLVRQKFDTYMEKETHIVESTSSSRSFMSVSESTSYTR